MVRKTYTVVAAEYGGGKLISSESTWLQALGGGERYLFLITLLSILCSQFNRRPFGLFWSAERRPVLPT